MSFISNSSIFWQRIWTMLRDPKGPRSAKIITLIALLYLVWPVDLIPDVLPLLGWLDDLGITTLAVWWLHRVARTY